MTKRERRYLSPYCPLYNATGNLVDGDCFCDSNWCNGANSEMLSFALALIVTLAVLLYSILMPVMLMKEISI